MKVFTTICLAFCSLLLNAQDYKINLGLGIPIFISDTEFANQNKVGANIQTSFNIEYNYLYYGIAYGITVFSSKNSQNVKNIINRPALEIGGIISFGENQIRPAMQLGYSFIRVKDRLFGERLVSEQGVFLAPKLSFKRALSNKISIEAYSIFNIDFVNMPYIAFEPVKQKSYTLVYLLGISIGYKIK